MIYYLTTNTLQNERIKNNFTLADNIAIQLSTLVKPIRTRIITSDSLLRLVDEGVMPSETGDLIFIRTYSSDILKYVKVLGNRGFKLVNSLSTSTLLRDVEKWTTLLVNENIPVRVPFNYQPFSKFNLDRTRGFGQSFEDFIIEYVKEHNLSNFTLRPRLGSARWNLANTEILGGHKITDPKTYNWSSVDVKTFAYYLLEGIAVKTMRVPVVGKQIIREACLSTTSYVIDNLKIEKNTDVIKDHPEILEHSNKIINALDLEVGFIDFQLVNDEIKVYDVSNLDPNQPNPFNINSLIVDYLSHKHEN